MKNQKNIICTKEDCFELFIQDFDKLLNGSRFVLIGWQTRWDGTSGGGDVLTHAIEIFKYLRDCDEFQVYEQKGHLYVRGVHHDGSVQLEIKILNKRGEEYYSRHYYDMSYKKVLSLFNNYSVLPHYFKRVFGY